MANNDFSYPILIYDNLCYSCTKYAKIVNDITNNKCLIVGHYAQHGKEIKQKLFPQGYEGLEMSWFIIDGVAYGGRSGFFRLIQFILFGRKKIDPINNEFDLSKCDIACKTTKTLLRRSISLFVMHKKFNVPNTVKFF